MRTVEADHPVFAGHFPGNPLLPGAYLLALVIEEARAWLGRNLPERQPAGVRAAKFTRAVRPGAPFGCEFTRAADGHALRFVVRGAAGEVHASGTIELAPAGPRSLPGQDACRAGGDARNAGDDVRYVDDDAHHADDDAGCADSDKGCAHGDARA